MNQNNIANLIGDKVYDESNDAEKWYDDLYYKNLVEEIEEAQYNNFSIDKQTKNNENQKHKNDNNIYHNWRNNLDNKIKLLEDLQNKKQSLSSNKQNEFMQDVAADLYTAGTGLDDENYKIWSQKLEDLYLFIQDEKQQDVVIMPVTISAEDIAHNFLKNDIDKDTKEHNYSHTKRVGVIAYSENLMSWYRSSLSKQIVKLIKQQQFYINKIIKNSKTIEHIIATISSKDFSKDLKTKWSNKTGDIALEFINKLSRSTNFKVDSILKKIKIDRIQTENYENYEKKYLVKLLDKNKRFIKDIPDNLIKNYLKTIKDMYFDGKISKDEGLEALNIYNKTSVKDKYYIEQNAVNVVRASTTQLSSMKLKDAGLQYFEWRHTSGERNPRIQHEELSGQIFRFDDLPLITEDMHGLPGQIKYCRCYMRPVIKSKIGNYNKGNTNIWNKTI